MIKQIFLPSSYVFWIIFAFLNFFFFYKTAQADLIHLSKLVLQAFFAVYVLIYLILDHKIDWVKLKLDKKLMRILTICILYIIWITLTNTVFSSAPSYTLLGWQDWYSGYFLYLMLMLFFVYISISSKMSDFSAGIHLLFWLSIFVAILCSIEYMGFDILLTSSFLQKTMHYAFAFSSASFPVLAVGNSGYIGSLWLILLPLPLLLQSQKKWILSLIWWVFLAIGLSSTHSKIAIIVAIVFFAIKFLDFIRRKSTSGYIIMALCIVISFYGSSFFEYTNTILYNKHIVSRNFKQNFDVARSTKDRLYIWEGSINAWKTRPLTGWGLETLQNTFFNYVSQDTLDYYGKVFAARKENESTRHFGNLLVIVPKYGKPVQLRRAYTSNVKPHNYFIEELYSNGIIGLALLIAFLISVANYCLISGSRESKLLLLGFGMYLVYLCGWFITIAISPLAFILLGFAVHLAAQKRAEDREALLALPTFALPDAA